MPPTDPARPAAPPGIGEETLLSPSNSVPVADPVVPPSPTYLGPYRVVRRLGEGGMGVVLLAEDPALGRPVALKVMRPELAAQPVARERFLREARAAAGLKYDHLVTIYQVGEAETPAGRVPFLAMEYLEGEPLADRLAREGTLSPGEIVRVGWETAAALAVSHAKGLVHRDIKPHNLFLEMPYGRVKVLDFGLARPAAADAELTGSGVIVGTPAYMSPEQARGSRVDGRSDLFSLGAVLYRCATGIRPFEGETVMAVLMALGTETPRPPHLLNPAVPPSLSALILRLLEKDPARRPTSALELLTLLAELVTPSASRPAGAAPVAPDLTFAFDAPAGAALAREPASRFPVLFALGALGLLALGVAGLGGWWLFGNRPSPTVVTRPEVPDPPPRPTAPARVPSAPWETVRERLSERNGFPVNGEVGLLNGEVVSLAVKHLPRLTDITPLRDLTALRELDLHDTGVADVRPLAGLRLTRVNISATGLADLSPLARVPVEDLVLSQMPVEDLSPLAGMPLRRLSLLDIPAPDLTPLRNLRTLTYLRLSHGFVGDLSPLAGLGIRELDLHEVGPLLDFAPLAGLPVTRLTCDAALLPRMPGWKKLEHLDCPDFVVWRDLATVRGKFPDLLSLNGKSFSEQAEAHDDFLKRIAEAAALPADERKPAVEAMLREFNPDWKGTLTVAGTDAEATVKGAGLMDLSPLRAFASLRSLTVKDSAMFADLWPLHDLPIADLDVAGTGVGDLRPLTGMALRTLRCPTPTPEGEAVLRGLPKLVTVNGKPAPRPVP